VGTPWAFLPSSLHMLKVFQTHREDILLTFIARKIGHEILGNAHWPLTKSRFVHRGGLTKLKVQRWIAKYELELENQTSVSDIQLNSDALPLSICDCRVRRSQAGFGE